MPETPAEPSAEQLIGERLWSAATTLGRMASDPTERQRILAMEVGRRGFSKAVIGTLGVAAATGTALTIRHNAQVIMGAVERQWPENEPTFGFVNKHGYKGQREIALFFPGYGDMNAAGEAKQWRRHGDLNRKTPTAYFDYSNQGASPKELADLMRGSIDTTKLESLTLFGRSMGGMMEIAVAAELGIPVKSMILCSSPYEIEDGRHGGSGKWLSGLPQNENLATAAKIGYNMYDSFEEHGFDLPTVFAETWHKSISGASPKALQREGQFMADFDFRDPTLLHKLKRVFIAGYTDIVYVETHKPNTDETVKTAQAARKYYAGFEKEFGIRMRLFLADYEGHANVLVSSEGLQSWIERTTGPKPKPKILAAK